MPPALFGPTPRRVLASRGKHVKVQAFKVQALGISKPRWLTLPDFGLEKRREVLDRFFGPINRQASLPAIWTDQYLWIV